ncbi:MAG TPA: TMEM175 family protein [Pyrinomonadaceae bacterium]|jgi:uncharacterized membrane protein|nr:TMEM175 family protein [Pyrinomonadaceae bacterium]
MSDKKGFQIERIVFFSDAVFAIAITLLIIEVKAPIFDADTTPSHAFREFLHLVPEFVGVLITFALIAMNWRRNHQLFGILDDYNASLITLNLMTLAAVIFLPFSTSFIAKNYAIFWTSPVTLPLVIYSFNNLACAFLSWRLFKYALDPENKLFDPAKTKEDTARLTLEVGYAAGVFVITTIAAFFGPFVTLPCFALFAFEPMFLKWRLKEKAT